MSNVASCISELLYENEVVIIPGFGAFVASYKPATIDYILGKIYPPSKNIVFNENMTTDDGTLLAFLKHKMQCSSADARSMIIEFVNEAKEKLNKKELLQFPELGKMYHDFDNKLQFIPDNVNFNTGVYGLPAVQFYPIFREKKIEEKKETTSSTASPQASKSHSAALAPKTIESIAETINTSAQQTDSKSPIRKQSTSITALIPTKYLMPGAAALIALAFLASINYYNQTSSLQNSEPLKLPVKMPYVNKKPSLTPTSTDPSISTEDMITDVQDSNEDILAKVEADIKKEHKNYIPKETSKPKETPKIKHNDASIVADKNICTVVIGRFKDKNNIQKASKKIRQSGYKVYTSTDKGLTRVGAQFFYKNESEKNQRIASIKRNFNTEAWVIE